VAVDRPPDVSVVVLTTGNRPEQLCEAIGSALSQGDVTVEVVVVANGAMPSELAIVEAEGVHLVSTPENVGIPAGRNLGAQHAGAAVLAFLDDDACFARADVLARGVGAMTEDQRLGAIALRIVDEHGHTARRHVPRIGSRHPDRSGPVTSFLGGAVLIRRAAFEPAGAYAGEFRYAMEETDLALRLIDRGWTIVYDGAPAVLHPRSDPARHAGAARRTMRNRVWLAYRNLPTPLAVVYVANWLLIATARQPRQLRSLLAGIGDGWRSRPRGQRSPIQWRTVVRLTRLGRPPVV
jgi:hypothetical protein